MFVDPIAVPTPAGTEIWLRMESWDLHEVTASALKQQLGVKRNLGKAKFREKLKSLRQVCTVTTSFRNSEVLYCVNCSVCAVAGKASPSTEAEPAPAPSPSPPPSPTFSMLSGSFVSEVPVDGTNIACDPGTPHLSASESQWSCSPVPMTFADYIASEDLNLEHLRQLAESIPKCRKWSDRHPTSGGSKQTAR